MAIRVLVVDDSLIKRELITHILSSDPELQVVGTARDGQEAIDAIESLAPDVITMDIEMPRLDGYEATRRIMATRPVPVIIVSSHIQPEDVATTFHSAQSGALAAVETPVGPGQPRYETLARRLVQTVKLMSEVRVVRRWQWNQSENKAEKRATPATRQRASEEAAMPNAEAAAPHAKGIAEQCPQIVAIGISTGGPPVLQTLLSGLGADFPLPVLIVQHIAPGFLQGLVEWLIQTTGFQVRLALSNEVPLPGYAYFAPEDFHMTVRKIGSTPRLHLSQEAPEHNFRPAVAPLFRSVTGVYGARAIGVLLTGMGSDGAHELKLLREAGGLTIAQDKESSVVHGMPGEAIKLGAARYVLPPERLAPTLRRLAQCGGQS